MRFRLRGPCFPTSVFRRRGGLVSKLTRRELIYRAVEKAAEADRVWRKAMLSHTKVGTRKALMERYHMLLDHVRFCINLLNLSRWA